VSNIKTEQYNFLYHTVGELLLQFKNILRNSGNINIRLFSFLLLFFCLLFFQKASSQSRYQIGVLPTINMNKELENDWSLIFNTESRQLFQNGDFDGNHNTEYEHVLTDVSLLIGKKVGLNSQIAGGYLIRFRNEEINHRAIQQFSMVRQKTGYTLALRIGADQTFSPVQSPEFRFRYRLTAEFPFNGQTADPKEFYFKGGIELLNKFQSTDRILELRVVPVIGYTFNDWNKIEFGLDYRYDSFFSDDPVNIFWTTVNWLISL
jgi:hypothetical protein